MPLVEVAASRRVVGRLDRGADVVRAVREAAARWNVTEAEVRAHGRLAWVEVAGKGPGVTERFDGPLDVVSLHGRVSAGEPGGDVEVALVVHALPPSPALPPVAGRLVACAAISIDVVLDPWETAAAATASPRPAPARPPPKAGWAKVVEASQKPDREVAPSPPLPPKRGGPTLDLDEPHPEVGDDVVHPHFGRCRVVESADDRISVRLPSGRVVQLGAKVLRFGEPTVDSDRRVFRITVRGQPPRA